MPNKNFHGGRRQGSGRPPRHLKPHEKRCAVWIIATPEEQELINTALTVDERKLILLEAVVTKQNGG